MNQYFTLFLVISLTIAACTGTKKVTLQKDLQTQQMVDQGKDLMKAGTFEKAADVFEEASLRTNSQSTTTALYLSGLAHFKRNASFPAQQQFEKLIRDYPKSRYANDARYHLALLKLTKYDQKEKLTGVNELFALAEKVKNKDRDLEKLARSAAMDFLFNQAGMTFLSQYYKQAEEPVKTFTLEAIIHQENKKGKSSDDLAARYQEHIDAGGRQSAFLDNLLAKPVDLKPVHEPDVIKVALMMPLYLDEVNFYLMDKIPGKSLDALEFYEGFNQAVEDFSPQAQKKIFLQVFDTKRDTSRIQFQLNQLSNWSPDVVVGDVFTTESQSISKWANENKVVQIVPFSANPILTQDPRGYTFLARSSVSTHGKQMAKYAAQGLLLNHVVVWTDGRRLTNSIAQSFIQEFENYGAQVTLLEIDSVYKERAQEDIEEYYKDALKDMDGIDGMYIPISNEESAGLILSSLAVQAGDQEVRVMGTPSWERFQLIPRQLKERFSLIFTSPYAENNNPEAYINYVNKHSAIFSLPPSDINVQGYGLGMYILNLLDIYDPKTIPLNEFIQKLEAFEAAHNSIYYNENQDNQGLHIFEYREGEVIKID